MCNFAKGINLKNAKAMIKKIYNIYFNFYQLIYSLPSFSCQDLKLLAATGFEISSFL